MTISAAEDALFQEWSKGRGDFVPDGVVNETAYVASDFRVLLVLKEVNAPGRGGWDLREFLRDFDRSQTWNVVTRWLRAIRALPDELTWSELKTVTKADRISALDSIAAMNLKKHPGGHTSKPVEIAEASARDADFIRRQFDLYSPDLVICCGSAVANGLTDSRYPDGDPPWQSTSRGVRFYEHLEGKHTIAYAHPAARVADSILHFALIDAIKEIRTTV